VFQRRGRSRLPIDRVKIELNPEADTIYARNLSRVVSAELTRIFNNELRFRRGLV
jgi:hypothetical protein